MSGALEDERRGAGGKAGERLTRLLVEAELPQLDPSVIQKFETYLALLLRWNGRTNLTAIRDENGILKRHFVESIACAKALAWTR